MNIDDPPREPAFEGRVLLVDDDLQIQQVYAKVLGRLGYVVETADNALAALGVLQSRPFDLVVSDIVMAEMSGTRFLRAIRELPLDIPVILITGAPEVGTTREALHYGAFRYLVKPVATETLAQAVRAAAHAYVVARALDDRVPFLEACRRIVRVTCRGVDWDFATIWTPSDGQHLRSADTWARPGFDSAAFESATKALEIEVGAGLPRNGWTCDTAEWIPDLSVESNAPRVALAVAAGFRSGFSVPLGTGGEVLAVLEFFSRKPCAPDLALLDLLAVSGARLSAQVHKERSEQRAMRAEAAQQSISVTLRAIMDCAPASICAVDEQGTILFINGLGPHQKVEDVAGTDWWPYMPPGDADHHRAHLRRIFATGVAETYETTVMDPEGRASSFVTDIGPLLDNNRVTGAVLVTQDVTELRRTQADFAASRQLAAIGSVAAGVAHEINTPIQFVNDSVQFLRDAGKDIFGILEKWGLVRRLATDRQTPPTELQAAIAAAGELEETLNLPDLRDNVPNALERCVDGIGRITNIVRAMKEFAYPARQEMAAVDLNRAIQSTLAIARNEYKYVANLDVDLGDLPPVMCSVSDINQVVLNLVVNAAHAIGDVVRGSNQLGTISVRTRTDGDDVVISVGDTGGGIPAAIAARVFEPFFTTKALGKGTGQGLALAAAVVRDKHGGQLSFESPDGGGTTFFVRLPVAGQPAANQ